MNAYENKAHELANWLETGEVEEIDLKESANMLRQLADELKACKIHDRRGWEYAEELEQERRKQADRIAELEKKLQESALDYISVCSQADEHYARVQELEKQLDIHFKNGFEAGKLEGWKAHKYYSTSQTKPLSDEEIEVLKEIIRISDRKHPLWDKAKEFLK